MKIWEDDDKGSPIAQDAQFRSYQTPSNSLVDYAQLLQADICKNVRKSNTNSHRDATKALTGTYATDTAYGDKVNRLIEHYRLIRFDTEI